MSSYDEDVVVQVQTSDLLAVGVTISAQVVAGVFSAVVAFTGTTTLASDGVGVGTSVDASQYTRVTDAAQSSDWAGWSTVVVPNVHDGVLATDLAQFFMEQLVLASASVQGTAPVQEQVVAPVADGVLITDTTLANVSFFETVAAAVNTTTLLQFGWPQDVVDSANAWGAPVYALRVAADIAAESVGVVSIVEGSAVPATLLLTDTGVAGSSTSVQTDHAPLLQAVVTSTDGATYNNPDARAWVMNTETTAVGWYSNFQFNSVAQVRGRTFAAGPDGLYELVGNTDEGDQIDAKVVSGLTDLGTAQTKRIDSAYFGYTSAGQISLTVETTESGIPPVTYYLEQRVAESPRNSRIVVGKGLYGRYWRLTLENVDGADFEIHDATLDVAVSPRRI